MPIIAVSFKAKLYTSEPLEDGKCPIVLQITWRDTKTHVRRKRLGLACYPQEFDTHTMRIHPDVYGALRINKIISDAIYRAEQIYYSKCFDTPWNYRLWAQLYDEKNDPTTFDAYSDEVINHLFLMERSGTAVFYRDSLRALQKYLRKEKIAFQEITKPVLKGLEKDFISRGFKGERTMRGIKGLFSKAIEEEVIDMKLMPFKTAYNPIGYKFTHLKKIKKRSSLIKRLSEEQLKLLMAYVPENEGEQKALDLWKFSYFTMGVNLKDIALMKYSDIRDGYWYYDRSKTDYASHGKPLLSEAWKIIDEYKKQGVDRIFSFILGEEDEVSDKRVNERIRDTCSNLRRRYVKICKKIGFPGHFTFYSARYTSATISANRGADLRAIQMNLTHASLRTTEIYSQYRNAEALRKSLELLRI